MCRQQSSLTEFFVVDLNSATP